MPLELVVLDHDPFQGVQFLPDRLLPGTDKVRLLLMVPGQDQLAPLGPRHLLLAAEVVHSGPHGLGVGVGVVEDHILVLHGVGGARVPLHHRIKLRPVARLHFGCIAAAVPLHPPHVGVHKVLEAAEILPSADSMAGPGKPSPAPSCRRG